MQKIKIILGDSQFLTRSGLERLINSQPELDLIGQVESGVELIAQVSELNPDVVILDYLTNDFSIDQIRQIRKQASSTQILIISADLVRDNIFKAIEFGANSYVTKNCSEQEIINAIVATAKNERFFCNRILEVFIDREQESSGTQQIADLTSREIEILQLIGKGYSTKELASMLHLSQHTIYTHRKNMMKKLNVNSSTDMILSAVNLGLIKPTRKTA